MASEDTIEVREISPPESITSQEVVCHCPVKPLGSDVPSQHRRDYFLCCRCSRLQHERCYYRDRTRTRAPGLGLGLGSLEYRCIPCIAAAHEEAKQEIADRKERERIYEEETRRKIQQEQKELRASVIPVLWRHYCLLPDSDTMATAVKEACALKFENGRMIPLHPAPASWAQAVDSNLKIMMGACGKNLNDVIRAPGFWKKKEMNTRILPSLQEIATRLIHHGIWKGQRQNLGVLGEVLGFEMKGTVWKGETEGT